MKSYTFLQFVLLATDDQYGDLIPCERIVLGFVQLRIHVYKFLPRNTRIVATIAGMMAAKIDHVGFFS